MRDLGSAATPLQQLRRLTAHANDDAGAVSAPIRDSAMPRYGPRDVASTVGEDSASPCRRHETKGQGPASVSRSYVRELNHYTDLEKK